MRWKNDLQGYRCNIESSLLAYHYSWRDYVSGAELLAQFRPFINYRPAHHYRSEW